MSINTRRAIVRARTIIACELFQSTEETRYYLNGVCIQGQANGGGVCVASDGHTIIAINEPDGYVSGLDTIWHCDAKKRLSALLASTKKDLLRSGDDLWVDLQYGYPGGPTMTAKAASSAQVILNGGGEPALMITDKTLYVDGSFPDWRRVWPKKFGVKEDGSAPDLGGLFAANARFVQRTVDVAKILGEPKGSLIYAVDASHLEKNGQAGSPMLFGLSFNPNVVGLIMPIRVDVDATALQPAWLGLTPVEADEEKTPQAEKQAR